MLYATYHPDEPLTNHLGLYKGPSSIPDADRLVQQILPRHLSLWVADIGSYFELILPCRFAYDSNGNVLGVCVNNAYYRAEFEQDLEYVSFCDNLLELKSFARVLIKLLTQTLNQFLQSIMNWGWRTNIYMMSWRQRNSSVFVWLESIQKFEGEGLQQT